jgi:hypothetical protein
MDIRWYTRHEKLTPKQILYNYDFRKNHLTIIK